MGMGFQFEKQAGIVGFELGFEKTISWEMGLGPPLHDPQLRWKSVALRSIGPEKPRWGVANYVYIYTHIYNTAKLK